MREVIPNCDTCNRAPQFHAAPDTLEARKGFSGLRRIDAGSLRRGDRRKRILKVVLALKIPAEQPGEPAIVEYFETARADGICAPAIAHAKPFHRAPAAASEDAVNRRVGTVDYEFAGSGYRSDEMMELSLNRCKIGEDVSMIELYIVQNRQPGPVVDHLGTLVEEGSIVFISFDHEIGLCSQPGRYAKVDRNAANEEPRVESRILQNPGNHGGSRRFSMCPSYGEHAPAGQNIFSDPLRAGNIAVASIEYRLHQRVAPAHDIPDYPHVRIQGRLIGTVPHGQLDALRFELCAHRRVDIGVAPGHSMAGDFGDRRNATHESAANAEYVDVQGAGRRAGKIAGAAEKGNDSSLLRCVFRLRYHAPTPACFSMSKESKFKQQQMRVRIAAAAARMMAEDGLDDFALAKRKAARQLGAEDTQALPKNEEIEAELRAYQSLYQGEEQRERINYLRECALEAMRLLEQFRPYLAGAVLKGTAGRYSDIDLQLFTDDGKAVELFLLNRNIAYDVSDHRHFAGDQARAVPVLKLDWQGVAVNLAIYTLKEERGTLRTTLAGRPIERAGIQAVTQLLSDGSS